MKKLLNGMLVVVGLLMAVPAFAASSCYSPAELEAEHLLRLHSELMVITVTCRVGSQGEDLPAGYVAFTKKHISLLHRAELMMTEFFNKHGGGGQDRLDKLRTRLGNEYGQKIADMSAQPFCNAYRDKVMQFSSASPDDVQAEIKRMDVAEKSYIAPCDAIKVAKANGKHN